MVKQIVEKLRQEREARGLTQADVGTRIGLTRQAIAASEIGRTSPGLDTLARWAEAVGCRLEVRLVPLEPGDAVVPWRALTPEVQQDRDDLPEQVALLATTYRPVSPTARSAGRALLSLLAELSQK